MTDEELLGLLGEAARERDGDDARWDAFAEGELEGEALEAFLAEERARATTPEALARLEARIEATRPLDEGLDAFVERTEGAIAAAPSEAPAAPVSPAVPSLAARRARVWGGAATVLAAAAAVFLIVRPAATPGYELEVSGGARTQRGSEETSARFHRDDHLVVVLRPTDRVDAAVRARVLSASGARLDVPVQVSVTGAVRLDVRVGELVHRPGPAEIGLEVQVGDEAPSVHRVRFEAID
ncbi:MAG: hypothetical protein H6722_22785 [Sandaracinus sp.]|nr:hypothetical protein [Sandaracinus sp.]